MKVHQKDLLFAKYCTTLDSMKNNKFQEFYKKAAP